MSERFEGLNLPRLLDLMHDIVVPEPVSMQPQTNGWWVVLGWIAAVIALLAVKVVQHRRRNKYRREALAKLRQIDTGTSGAAGDIASIVKRTALVAYPRPDVASLYGTAWVEFLVTSANNDSRVERGAAQIAAAPYQPGIDANEIIKPAKRWVKVHRA